MKELTSLQHPLVKHLIKLRKNGDYRHACKSVMIEGIKLVSEVCVDHPATVVVACEASSIPSQIKTEESILVSKEVMQKIQGPKIRKG